jgi:hypothetical protein
MGMKMCCITDGFRYTRGDDFRLNLHVKEGMVCLGNGC